MLLHLDQTEEIIERVGCSSQDSGASQGAGANVLLSTTPYPLLSCITGITSRRGEGWGRGRKQTAPRLFFSNSGGKSLVTKCMQQTVLCYADRGLNTIILNLKTYDPTIKTRKNGTENSLWHKQAESRSASFETTYVLYMYYVPVPVHLRRYNGSIRIRIEMIQIRSTAAIMHLFQRFGDSVSNTKHSWQICCNPLQQWASHPSMGGGWDVHNFCKVCTLPSLRSVKSHNLNRRIFY